MTCPATQASSPCRAFGHASGRYGSGGCKVCSRFYSLIRVKMVYWFNRIILGLKSRDSHSGATRAQQRVLGGRSHRRRYAARRRAGLSSYAAKYDSRSNSLAQSARYRERWGGHPHIGSRAWVEREAYNLAKKLDAIGG
jgi:hypothetical protein